MNVQKGDRVRIASGETGEVAATWGVARSFISLRRDSDGKTAPMFQSEVVEITRKARVKSG